MKDDGLMHDGLAFDGKTGSILHDSDGVPVEWTILRTGRNEFVRNGQASVLELTDSDMAGILAYHRTKGERIPVDSNHYLYRLAMEKGLDENTVRTLVPAGVAAMGFGELSLRNGELRIHVSWNPVAHELLREKIFRYFSPVVRGLLHPPVRVTSVALENEPAINGLDELAASARVVFSLKRNQSTGQMPGKECTMNRNQEAEKDPEVPADVEVPRTDNAYTELLKRLRLLVEAPETASETEVFESLRKAVSDGKAALVLRGELARRTEEIEALLKGEEVREKEKMIEDGLASGKLTNELARSWAREQDCQALASYLEHAPVIVPLGHVRMDRCAAVSGGALTEQDRRVMAMFGFEESAYRAAKQMN